MTSRYSASRNQQAECLAPVTTQKLDEYTCVHRSGARGPGPVRFLGAQVKSRGDKQRPEPRFGTNKSRPQQTEVLFAVISLHLTLEGQTR